MGRRRVHGVFTGHYRGLRQTNLPAPAATNLSNEEEAVLREPFAEG